MKIWEYLNLTPEKFRTDYLETRLVDVATHPEFPLQMLTYGREAVHTNNWDAVIRKCRGIIYSTETEDIVARPFEKFFNLGTAGMPETTPSDWTAFGIPDGWKIYAPEVWEKMDGFLCTLYTYNNQQYIASKGSFDSVHAKWATAQIRHGWEWPEGYTPVFEGICPSIRIVVDYENFEGLVLLALVHTETGEELNHRDTVSWAERNGLETPSVFGMTWQEARTKSLDTEIENFEGYVLVWRRPGQTPFRLKVKYVDYLRLHRMVSGVSAKAIYNCLAGHEYQGDLNEWMNESTPWFNKFVTKWVKALQSGHDTLLNNAGVVWDEVHYRLKDYSIRNWDRPATIRKAYAEEFNRHTDIRGILFAMYDGKDASEIAWKLTKPLIKSSQPMIHGKDLL